MSRGRFFICAIRGTDESDAPLRAAYKGMGYRLIGTEPYFARAELVGAH